MKLQISFDLTDLDKALSVASQVVNYADVFELGTLLIFKYGLKAIEAFDKAFPKQTILADTKIVDRSKDIVNLLATTEVNWITVMAGTRKDIIHAACAAAHNNNKKVMLDLLDARSQGESALEAKNLGADALLFHRPYTEAEAPLFLDTWEMVKGNSNLPIFVSAKIKRDNINEVLAINPHGIIIGSAITQADNPQKEAKFFYELCNPKK